MTLSAFFCLFFFFNDTATTEIYTLSLHDALPISRFNSVLKIEAISPLRRVRKVSLQIFVCLPGADRRSEEHTSELQSPDHLVCRLLLEKKKIRSALDSDAGSSLSAGATINLMCDV